MAFCIECGKPITDGVKFCPTCGASQEGTTHCARRETIYEGQIHKCPNCGETINSFVTNCPSCGYEIRSIKSSSPVNELAKKLEKATSVEEKVDLIKNFYVPNTKEDVFDFFIMAVSNLESSMCDTDDAWQAKLEQSYHKAKILLGNTPEFDYLEKLYHKTLATISKRGASKFVRRNKTFCIVSLCVVAGIIMLAVGIIMIACISADENWGGAWGGFMLISIGMLLLIYPVLILLDMPKKSYYNKNDMRNSNGVIIQSPGKSAIDFTNENYEDVAEQLRTIGFNNIVLKPEKKGLLDTEGAVKMISIAGITDFNRNDEFEANSKVIIRYYSRKH